MKNFYTFLFASLLHSVSGQPLLDSISKTNESIPSPSSLFQNFGGSINSLFNNNQASGSFDLSVQTYHYFLVTSRRFKNDSIHRELVEQNKPLQDIYQGVHFYLLNRAAIDFDTLRAIANNYLTSLLASPLTLRIKREVFLTQQHALSPQSLAPVISLLISADARAIPFGDASQKVNIGGSGHLFITLSALFKRIEFDARGAELDNGIMYLHPTFGIAYGTTELMKSVLTRNPKTPVLTSGCRLGFSSEKNKLKDFSFLMQYTLTDILGPKLRAGIILSSF